MRSADGSESVEDFSLHSRALDPVANFEGATHILNHNPSGGDSGGDPPVPIPNTEVKPSSADGTWGESPRESRTLPGGHPKSFILISAAIWCILNGANRRMILRSSMVERPAVNR